MNKTNESNGHGLVARTGNSHPEFARRVNFVSKVSFGADDQIRLYDNGTTTDGPLRLFKRSSLNRRRSFTESDSSPARAKISSQDAEVPRPISPPIQIAATNSQMVATPAPVLPSITKRMEKERENPFRPNAVLFHEVDPIIEAYKNKPFPPSPSPSYTPLNSPVPHEVERSASLAEVRREIEQNRHAEQVNKSNLPPPHKPEVIHVEGKKRCAPCCTVQ